MKLQKYFTENISELQNNSDKISLDGKTFEQKILPNLISEYRNAYCKITGANKFFATVQIIRKPNGLQTKSTEGSS